MRPRVLVASAVGLLAALLLTFIGITIFESKATGVPASVSRPADLLNGVGGPGAPTPAPPRLEAQSGQDFVAYRAAAEQKLRSYRWVDRAAGVVAIPIDRAMDLISERGLPARTDSSASQTSPTSASSGRAEAAYP